MSNYSTKHLNIPRIISDIREACLDTVSIISALQNSGFNLEISLEPILQQLDAPFSIFVCGEFNSGKSSLINAILGSKVAEVGILPTTSQVVALGSPKLDGIVLVDSPGTNSLLEAHQDAVEHYIPRADFVMLVTSVERLLSHSEINFIKMVAHQWKREIVLVVSKVDIIDEASKKSIDDYVNSGLKNHNIKSHVHYVSSKNGAGVDKLIEWFKNELGEGTRVRLKLSSPINAIQVYLDELNKICSKRLARHQAELLVIDRVLEKARTKAADHRLLFSGFSLELEKLFSSIAFLMHEVVDHELAAYSIIKRKVSGSDLVLKGRVIEVISDCKLDANISAIVNRAAELLKTISERIVDDAEQDLDMVARIAARGFQLPKVENHPLEVPVLVELLLEATNKAMSKFLTFGSAAAASGVGLKVIGAAALSEVAGIALLVGFLVLSIRALPRERLKAKTEITRIFSEMAKVVSENMILAIKNQLDYVVSQIESTTETSRLKLRSDIDLSTDIINKISSLNHRCTELLSRLDQ